MASSSADAMLLEELERMENLKLNEAFRELDIVFLLDCTGSMGSYITSATQNIELICNQIISSEKLASPECLRIGLIAYRDHPPQDNSYVTKNFGFQSGSNVHILKGWLSSLNAGGGGDGPEAVSAAMKEMFTMDWRPNAAKIAVLITDAPPHAIGESGDGFSEGTPDGSDVLILAREMASHGVTLFIVACEPGLSGYSYALDCYRALTEITSGVLLPLMTANHLAHVIVGSALEHLDMERLIREVGQAVADKLRDGQESVDEVARELHERLMLRNENTKQLIVDNVYRDTPESRHNVKTYMEAANLASARPKLKRVYGTRLSQKYLESKFYQQNHPYKRYSKVTAVESTPIVTNMNSSSSRQFQFRPLKVNLNGTSFHSPNSSPPPDSNGFGHLREPSSSVMEDMMEEEENDDELNWTKGGSRTAWMQDEEEEKELRGQVEIQTVLFQRKPITIEQARRITMASGWRGIGKN